MFPVLNILEYFGAHVHIFFFGIYLDMTLSGHGVCICSALPDTANYFPKLLYQFILPPVFSLI